MSSDFVPFKSLEEITLRPIKEFGRGFQNLIESKLWVKIILAMFLGIFLGALLSQEGPFAHQLQHQKKTLEVVLNWISFPGSLFLKLIQMVLVPLIIASIMRGLAFAENINQLKFLAPRFAFLVLFNTVLAALLGIGLTSFMKPGLHLSLEIQNTNNSAASGDLGTQLGGLFHFSPDTFLNMLPHNPLASMVQGQMLQVVIMALLSGVAMLSLEIKVAKSILDLLQGIQEICMQFISWAMKLAPLAVFGFMVKVAASTGVSSLLAMGYYLICVFSGFFLLLSLYLICITLMAQISPWRFLSLIKEPLLLAFSTSSSAVTMPLSMKTAEEVLNLPSSIVRLVIPLGATVNMAGSAIWHTTAIVFVVQAYGGNLGPAELGLAVTTSVVSAIGAPGVPGVGIGIVAVVLGSLGIPAEGIALILGVDRLVDMGCTVVNVAGDLALAQLLSLRSLDLKKKAS